MKTKNILIMLTFFLTIFFLILIPWQLSLHQNIIYYVNIDKGYTPCSFGTYKAENKTGLNTQETINDVTMQTVNAPHICQAYLSPVFRLVGL